MSCEECKFYDEHPYIRDGDYEDYCDFYHKRICDIEDSGYMCEHYTI